MQACRGPCTLVHSIRGAAPAGPRLDLCAKRCSWCCLGAARLCAMRPDRHMADGDGRLWRMALARPAHHLGGRGRAHKSRELMINRQRVGRRPAYVRRRADQPPPARVRKQPAPPCPRRPPLNASRGRRALASPAKFSRPFANLQSRRSLLESAPAG